MAVDSSIASLITRLERQLRGGSCFERLAREEEAMEAMSFRNFYPEEESTPQSACPSPTRYTVSGFPRYRYSGASLPAGERQKLRRVAADIASSHQYGCTPIETIHLVGHADRDVQRGRNFENQIARKRALGIRDTLLLMINNPPLCSRLHWSICSMGSNQLVVQSPRTEAERARNRRVEVIPSTATNTEPIPMAEGESEIPLAGCSPPPQVCHGLSITVHTNDHGDYSANLLVHEPEFWTYMDSVSLTKQSGTYENGHGRGLAPTGSAFVDPNSRQVVFFLNDFLPFNHTKYPPVSAFSKGNGKFINPPAQLKLATPNIEWQVLEVKDC